MSDFEMILKLSIFIFGPILLIYPIFFFYNRKTQRIKNMAVNHPELIESLELYEGEDLILFVKLKGMRTRAIAHYSEAKSLYLKLQELIR